MAPILGNSNTSPANSNSSLANSDTFSAAVDTSPDSPEPLESSSTIPDSAPGSHLLGATRSGGTLDHSCTLLTHSNLRSLLAITSGPIKSLSNAHKWLEFRGWILAAEPYDHAKATSILVIAALAPKQLDLKNTALAIALLLETDITDHISTSLMNTVTDKAIKRFNNLFDKLSTIAKFLAANNVKCAETRLALKATSELLAKVSISLSTVTSAPLPATAFLGLLNWAAITKAALSPPMSTNCPQSSLQPSGLSSKDLIRVQQWILRNAHMVLLQFDLANPHAPKDLSIPGLASMQVELNSALEKLNTKHLPPTEREDGEVVGHSRRTHMLGMKAASSSAFLIEFNTADSAARFHGYIKLKLDTLSPLFRCSATAVKKPGLFPALALLIQAMSLA
ncbi:hypothetical protein C0989_007146 [Termitomyces sp. Mn162]|nr:hypothetical protein C0989_007146 [Termitomyces sp. Mn162]